MKKINEYIKESQEDGKNGHWLYTTDKNGNLTKTWVDYEEIVRKRKEQEAELKKSTNEKEEARKKKIEEKKKLQKEYEDLEDQMFELEENMKELYRQHRELEIDQEEQVGGLYAAGEEEEAEKLAQDFGEQFNQIEKDIESTQKQMEKIQDKMAEIENKLNK